MILELYIKVVFLKVRAATPLVVGKKHLFLKKKKLTITENTGVSHEILSRYCFEKLVPVAYKCDCISCDLKFISSCVSPSKV